MREIEVNQQKNLRDFDLRDITLNKCPSFPYFRQGITLIYFILKKHIYLLCKAGLCIYKGEGQFI